MEAPQTLLIDTCPLHFGVSFALHPDERHRFNGFVLDGGLNFGHQAIVQIASGLWRLPLGVFPCLVPSLYRLTTKGVLNHDHLVCAESFLDRRRKCLVRAMPLHVGLA